MRHATLPTWPTHLLGPNACDTFANPPDTYGGKAVSFDLVRRKPVFVE